MVNYSRLFGKSRAWRRPSFMARLPESYYRHRQQLEQTPERVHDAQRKGDLLDHYVADPKTLRIERRADAPVKVVYPAEAEDGLWGGEGVVKGFLKYRDMYGRYSAKYWFPNLAKTVVYSEILDKYLSITMTPGALVKIDAAHGFDNYILNTPEQNLKSKLALDLRRKMLIALAKKDYHPSNPEKRKYVEAKYKDFVVPLEQAEWIGLSEPQAVTKNKIKEAIAASSTRRPLKETYTRELLKRLEHEKETKGEEPSQTAAWFKAMFGSKEEKPS